MKIQEAQEEKELERDQWGLFNPICLALWRGGGEILIAIDLQEAC